MQDHPKMDPSFRGPTVMRDEHDQGMGIGSIIGGLVALLLICGGIAWVGSKYGTDTTALNNSPSTVGQSTRRPGMPAPAPRTGAEQTQ